MIQRSARWYLLYFSYCAGIVLGAATASGFPPGDPSFWLMVFCLGGITGLLYPEEFKK